VLKKHSIGVGNKEFANALNHFVNCHTETEVRKAQQRAQRAYKSRISQIKRLHNYSFKVGDLQQCSVSRPKRSQKETREKRAKTVILDSSDEL
jgi:hypothetical protein